MTFSTFSFQRGKQRRGSDSEFSDDDDVLERQTKYTGFSVSSSVMHRNPQLTLLDDRFDKVKNNDLGTDMHKHAKQPIKCTNININLRSRKNIYEKKTKMNTMNNKDKHLKKEKTSRVFWMTFWTIMKL